MYLPCKLTRTTQVNTGDVRTTKYTGKQQKGYKKGKQIVREGKKKLNLKIYLLSN